MIIQGILYGFAGLALLVLLIAAMAKPLLPTRWSWPDRSRLGRKSKLIEEVDRFLKEEMWLQAVPLLQRAICLDDAKVSVDVAEKVNQHNFGILSRVLLISEKQGKRLESLAIVEDLLLSRREMVRALSEASAGKATLTRKRGRDVPAWALEEYRKKISELSDQLATNRRSLESQFTKLFVEVLETREPIEVPFH